MSGKKSQRWQDLDHSDELLLSHVGGAKSTTGRSAGPIPEFLAKKAAERAPKTHEWYREALMQLSSFIEEHELEHIGDFT